MKKLVFSVRPLVLFLIFIFIFLIITKPEVCTSSAARGIVLCGRVIIPSLFPFTVCVLFIMNSGALSRLGCVRSFSEKVFHLSPEQFAVMLLSFIGGYPIGAKLVNELYLQKKVSSRNASLMTNYCVNAGPAFIILAVGDTIYASKTAGYILLISHILSSVVIALVFRRFLTVDNCESEHLPENVSAADNFVLSASGAASTVFGICGYVIFFSTLSGYVELFAQKFNYLHFVNYFLEVTIAVSSVKNLLFASFILGFSGICIWCQVLSVSKQIKFNFPVFAVTRIIHGLLSIVITAISLHFSGISVTVFSTDTDFRGCGYTTLAVAISMISMAIIFLISLTPKKHSGNILKDLV